MGIARTFQDLRLINGMTVIDNVLMVLDKKMLHIATFKEYQKVRNIIEKVSLSEVSENLGSDLSYGQQKLLTLGCCLANSPQLLLLDEPIAGIDRENRVKIKNLVMDLRREGKSILQIEHDVEYLKETSDQIFIIEVGQLKNL